MSVAGYIHSHVAAALQKAIGCPRVDGPGVAPGEAFGTRNCFAELREVYHGSSEGPELKGLR